MRTLSSAVAGAFVVLLLMAGIAWAACSDRVVHGCYQTAEGMLRVTARTTPCRSAERAIEWSKDGVAGAKGAKGDPGVPGVDGRNGRDGADVTVVPEPIGKNCATGGARIVKSGDVTYVCSALPPDPGGDH
jgi:hypothetical protein